MSGFIGWFCGCGFAFFCLFFFFFSLFFRQLQDGGKMGSSFARGRQ